MATVYNDAIFGQKVLQQLNTLLLPLKAFTLDISDELKGPGDRVSVPLYGNITTTTFTQATTVMEQTGGTVSAVTVTLDERFITPVDLTHQQLLESSTTRFDRFTTQMAKSISKTILQDILSIVTTVNFGEMTTTLKSSSWALAQLITARKAMKTAGVEDDMSLVTNLGIEAALLGDTTVPLWRNQMNGDVLESGRLPKVMGFDIYSSSVFPTNSISLNAFACQPDAIAVAFRGIQEELPDAEYETVLPLVDDETGLSLLLTRHWSRAQGKWFINMHCLYGRSVAVTLGMKLFGTTTAD